MRVLLPLVLAAGLLGCDATTTLVVVQVDSDLSVPDEIDEVVVEVAGQSASAPLGGPDDPPLPRTVELRATGDGLGPYTVTARGLLDGVEVVSESRDVMFVAEQTVEVRITLTRTPMQDGGAGDGGPGDGGPDDGGPDDGGVVLADGCVAEACNGIDDDCDMQVDEEGACAPCVRSTFDGHTYLACDLPVTRSSAVSECETRGYQLVKIEVVLENQHVRDQITAMSDPAWIGLTRRGGSPNFEWDDMTPMGFDGWASGEPMSGNACVVFDPARGWLSAGCAPPHPFVCETP